MEKTPLYEFYVAGVQHHELHTCIKDIEPGDNLMLVAEPNNPYDPNAVRIEFNILGRDRAVMLGYVPMAKGDLSTKVSADLMIRPLSCEVLEVNPEAKTWEQLKVAIYDEDGKPGKED